jgi:hypothetical protein
LRRKAFSACAFPSLLDLFELLATPHYRRFDEAKHIVQLLYGTQAYSGDYHLTSFTAVLLDGYLRNAGLLVCHASLRDGWLFDVCARKTSRLADDIEFLHSAYFSILNRPADAGGIESHKHALASGVARADVEASLRDSDEARFLAKNPSYLVRHANYLPKPPAIASIARTVRAAARALKSRMRRSR